MTERSQQGVPSSEPRAVGEDRLCMACRTRESAHTKTASGVLQCPPVITYFTPCTHAVRHGFGTISSDGSSTGESLCQICGWRVTW